MFWVLQWLCGSCTGFQFNPVKVGNGTLLFPKAVIELRMTGEDDLCRVSSRKVTYHDTFRNPCTHSSLVWSDVLTVLLVFDILFHNGRVSVEVLHWCSPQQLPRHHEVQLARRHSHSMS